MAFEKVSINIVERLAPERGPTSSKDYNSSQKEIINALTILSDAWNNELYPLISSLPSGEVFIALEDRTTEINPFINGFDGSQVYTDLTASLLVDEGSYYDSVLARPLTIKETFIKVNNDLLELNNTLSGRISDVETNVALTYSEKQAIGIRIFEPSEISSPTSLDGRINLLELNVDQIALDIAGELDYLHNDGTKTLVWAIIDQLESLKDAHNYSDIDNTTSHSNLGMHKHLYHVLPIGALDGVNLDYLVPPPAIFTQGTLRVYVNGLELRKGADYLEYINGTGFSITAEHGALKNDGTGSDDYLWVHYDSWT